ncbi:MAG: MFS transporter [Solirubrobacteraceae bacterium]
MLPGPLRAGAFRLLFAGRAISSLGDRLVPVALAFAVLELTGSVTDLGIVMGAQTAALLAFVLVGGVWADRLPRRSVMLGSDAVRLLAQGACAALLLAGDAKVWQLAALQALYGAAAGFFAPASVAIVPQVAPADELQQANALLGLTDNGSSVLGPALAGVIVATAGSGWGLAADALTFALSGVLLALMRVAPDPAPTGRAGAASVIAELRAGWRAFRSRTWLWVTVLYFALYVGLVLSAFQVLGPEVARTALGGPGAWAAISAALGLGAVAGGMAALRWRPRHPLRAGLLMFLWAGPALLVGLGFHAPLWALLAVALIDGAAGSLFNAFWFTAQQSEVPAQELSRVSSWDHLGTLALAPLGLLAIGPVSEAIGISTTLYAAGGVIVLLTAAVMAVPDVRDFTGGRASASPGQ